MASPQLIASLLELSSRQTQRCLFQQFHSCQSLQLSRQISKSTQQRSQIQTPTPPPKGNNSSNPDDEHKPFHLKRPLGLDHPPQAGENTGKDTRTLRQRSEDLVDKDKHIQRRAQLAKDFTKPYFRDFLRTRYHQGKTFISNPRLFKGDSALYFPNLYGRTLDKEHPLQDTTPTLKGKISVVSVFATLWAEHQTTSFVGEKENPGLHKLIRNSGSVAQRVELNVEQNWLKAALVRWSMSGLRKKYPPEQHGRYFLVPKGFSDTLKQQIGMLNGLVGYVYLLDDSCKIRWAGSSVAQPDELASLNNGLRKLIDQKKASLTPSDEESKPIKEKKPRVVVR